MRSVPRRAAPAAPRRSASRERLLGPLARALEHGVEHRRGELARERVLLAGVEAAEQPPVLRAVAEAWPRARRRPVRERRDAQRRLPRERAEADDHARRPDEVELALEPRRASLALLGERLVGRRRAAHGGGDEAVAQLEPVVAVLRRGLVREARAVQAGEQEVARAIAREDAPRAVAA